jgi:hypothetical protein
MATGLFNLKQVNQAITQGAWPNQTPPTVQFLVVAGGAGGGFNQGGGGGAGGLRTGVAPVVSNSAYTVTVGAGGAGSSTNGVAGSTGSNSVFGGITSNGGGGGGSGTSGAGASGGSGGGGASTNGGNGSPGIPGQGISGQGNAGNAGFFSSGASSGWQGGGGGGAGTVGLNAFANGNGGAGIASALSGTVTAYAGGGGSGTGSNAYGGYTSLGGAGGGGAGATGNGTNGTANTGGGGGGSGSSGSVGATGGSGIAIVSYPDVYAAAASTTGSPTVSTSGAGSILFNGSSQYLSTSATQVVPATGDFTVEAWIYPTTFTGSPVFCGQGSAGDAGRTLFYISTGGVPTFSNGSSFTLVSTGTVSLNTWTYLAFTRSGNTGTWYINGASAGTGSLSGITIQNTFVTIGGSNPLWTAQYFTGYISNFRISDVARTITSTPTAPLPPIANTKLLLNTASGAFLADASATAYTFTNNGTSTWNQLSPFATGLGYKNRVYTWTSSGSITF